MLAGAALLAAGFFVGYRLEISATLADRVRMWQSPWDNVARGGDQIAQALWSMSTGGLFGTGIGLGDTRYLPAGHTDLVLASVAEELGFAGLLAVGAGVRRDDRARARDRAESHDRLRRSFSRRCSRCSSPCRCC